LYSVLRLFDFFTLFVSLFTPFPGSGTIQCGDNIEINNLFSSASLFLLWVFNRLGESSYLFHVLRDEETIERLSLALEEAKAEEEIQKFESESEMYFNLINKVTGRKEELKLYEQMLPSQAKDRNNEIKSPTVNAFSNTKYR
jgi:hypothetical protein